MQERKRPPRWIRQPQRSTIRKAVYQVHLWSGVIFGLYIFFISVTGSVLVHRNELYVAATPEVSTVQEGEVATGILLVSGLIDLHDNLLGGTTGREVNGVAAVAVLLVILTGLFIWWPGVKRWKRSMTLRRSIGWRRFTWDLHSAVGFWSFAFTFVFAVSGIYLCFPVAFHSFADWLTPPTLENAGQRFVDGVLYWLAFSHFGRIDGIGIPCSGPGFCDQAIKAVWATFGLAPAVMFGTGAVMWWNRVLRRWLRRSPKRLSV